MQEASKHLFSRRSKKDRNEKREYGLTILLLGLLIVFGALFFVLVTSRIDQLSGSGMEAAFGG